MNPLGQAMVIATISFAAAGGTYWVKGPPVRAYVCDPASLKPGEICLQQVPTDAPILWIDARPRKDWEKNGIKESILWNLDPAEDTQAFEAEAVPRILETPRVVVYCTSENCGISHQVAARIRELGLGAEVWALKGGWDALRDSGRVKSE